jgi:outer membrane lipase/esterase
MMKMTGKLGFVLLAAGFIVFLTIGTGLAEHPKNEVIVIGDSLSDPGNLYSLTGELLPPSPPYAQRYSNGPVWTEYFSVDMGIPVDSRAYGGALSGVFQIGTPVSNFNSVQYPVFGLPGVSEEIDALLEEYPQGLNPKALYVVWAGANDFFLGLTLMQMQNNDAEILNGVLTQTITNITGSVCRLSAAGAKHFAVGNLPDIGLTPFAKEMGPESQALFSFVIASFNESLEQALTDLPSGCAKTMVILDSYQILHDIADDPEFFGLDNVEEACLTQPEGPGAAYSTCDKPDEYLFWDSVHPTTAGQEILAEEFRAVICGTGKLSTDLKCRTTGSPHRTMEWRDQKHQIPRKIHNQVNHSFVRGWSK